MIALNSSKMALLAAVALGAAGCAKTTAPLAEAGNESMLKDRVTQMADGSYAIDMSSYYKVDWIKAMAEFRMTHPGEFVMKTSDARSPFYSSVVWMVPVRATNSAGGVNVLLSESSFPAVDHKGN